MLGQLRMLLSALDTTDRYRVGRKTKAQHISEQFEKLWTNILGKRVNLLCDDKETTYLTQPYDALEIQTEIAKHTGNLKVIVDAFACIGGDSLAAIYIHRNADVYAIQRVESAEERERFQRLVHNLTQFRGVFRRTGRVTWYQTDIGHFLTWFQSPISLLYLDPPWALGEDTRIASSDEIRDFLTHNVFNSLQGKAPPRMICFKLPHKVHNITEWPHLQAQYAEVKYIHMRGKYHVYILQMQ